MLHPPMEPGEPFSSSSESSSPSSPSASYSPSSNQSSSSHNHKSSNPNKSNRLQFNTLLNHRELFLFSNQLPILLTNPSLDNPQPDLFNKDTQLLSDNE